MRKRTPRSVYDSLNPGLHCAQGGPHGDLNRIAKFLPILYASGLLQLGWGILDVTGKIHSSLPDL